MSEKFLKTGGFTQASTAVAVDIGVGFKPSKVVVINETDRNRMEWNDQMADGEALVTDEGGIQILITANGITPIDGDHDTVQGFTFGLDTAGNVNVASKVITWEAIR